MARREITTQDAIDKLLGPKSRPKSGQHIVTVLGGLDLVVGKDGPGRWRYRYRPRGFDPDTEKRYPQRSMTIGTTDTHSLKEAGLEAAALKLRVAKGEDPALADRAAATQVRAEAVATERKAAIDEAARVTCRIKLGDYRDAIAARGRSAKHQREELAQVRLALESVGLMDATPAEVTAGHVDKILAGCPPLSRALRFGALDRFLRWANSRGQGAAPATSLLAKHERPRPPAPRQRVLAAAEVACVWNATGSLRAPALSDLVRFLCSTPCREGEAARATWAEIDFPGRTWTQATSKNGRPHRFPLNDRAMAVLAARREATGRKPKPTDLVFPAPRSGEVFGGWSNLKQSLDDRTGEAVASWRIHDLRRTAATALGEEGYDDALIDMLLNHTAAGTRSVLTRTYNTAQRWDDRVRAMHAWGRWIGAALGEEEPAATVVDLADARRRVA